MPDWQGTIGDAARDPWGAAPSNGSSPHLGYRGELEFAGQTWLRNRLYEPATRSFGQPDPMAPVPGTAWIANAYHYAANNPIGRADPLGLRPVTEDELNDIRNKMDRNLLELGVDWSDDISAGLGAAAMLAAAVTVVFPPAGVVAAGLGAASLAFGGIATGDAAIRRDWSDLATNAVGMVPGGGALRLASRARKVASRIPAATLNANAARALDDFARTPVTAGAAMQLGLKQAGLQAEQRALVATGKFVDAAGGVVGTGYYIYDKFMRPPDDPPKCEPMRPEPLRVPKFR